MCELSSFITIAAIGVVVCVMFQLAGENVFVILWKLSKFNTPTVNLEFRVNPTSAPPYRYTVPGLAL